MTPNYFRLSAFPFTIGMLHQALQPLSARDMPNADPVFERGQDFSLTPSRGPVLPKRDWQLLPAPDSAVNSSSLIDLHLIEGRVHFQSAWLRPRPKREAVLWTDNRLPRFLPASLPLRDVDNSLAVSWRPGKR